MNRLAASLVLLFALTTALCVPATGAVRRRLDTDLSCTITVGFGPYVRYGAMVPLILEFENGGAPRELIVRTGPEIVLEARLSVPAGGKGRRCLYVPAATGSLYGLRHCEFIDATTGRPLQKVNVEDEVSRMHNPWAHGSSPGRPVLACVTVLRTGSIAVNPGLDPSFTVEAGAASQGSLPDHWTGYSCADVVVLDHDLWAEPGFDRGPLVAWMAMGGICLMLDAPAGAPAAVTRDLREHQPPFLEERDGEPRETDSILVGMGGMAFVTKEMLAGSHRRFFAGCGLKPGLFQRDNEYGDYAGYGYEYETGSRYPPIEGVGRPPFWPVLVALMVFSIIVGPLGWWYLVSRKRRGMLYYVGAPALSAAVMGLIIVADVLHEGIRPFLSCVAVRFIDQRVNRRIDLSQFGVYVPFNVGVRLAGNAGEMAHLFGAAGSPRSLRLTLSGDRCLYGSALASRRSLWFGRESLELERRRLVVWEEAGQVWVENHLGCDLRKVALLFGGRAFRLDQIRAGAKVPAAPVDPARGKQALADHRAGFLQMAGRSLLGKAMRLESRWARAAGGGNAYVAEADGAVREHVWLNSFRPRGVQVLVFGVF